MHIEVSCSLRKFFIFQLGGEGSCDGDSGGPLFIFNDDPSDPFFTQVAIVSGGKPNSGPCSPSAPGIYTRIDDPQVFAWIQEIAFGRKAEGVDNSDTDATGSGKDYCIQIFSRYRIALRNICRKSDCIGNKTKKAFSLIIPRYVFYQG